MIRNQKVFLITAIGSFSAKSVVETIKENYSESKIIGTDIYPAEWHYLKDSLDYVYKVPKANEENYFSEIKKIIIKHQVDFLMPLTDLEIDILNEKRGGLPIFCELTLSCNKTIKMFRNKHNLASYFSKETTFKTIQTLKIKNCDFSKLKFPLIAKINDGRSSKGLRHIYNIDELYTLSDEYVLQPFIKGKIITVDLVVDYNKDLLYVPRRELLRTANGAGLSVQVFHSDKIYEIIKNIVFKIKILGAINIEFIETANHYYLMDVNPRFSAGVGFSKLSGIDVVKNHFRVFEKKGLESSLNFKNGLFVSTFEQFSVKTNND